MTSEEYNMGLCGMVQIDKERKKLSETWTGDVGGKKKISTLWAVEERQLSVSKVDKGDIQLALD